MDGDTINIPMIYRLLYVNVFLVIFNMLPAFPMDGGRVLRAGLAFRMPHHKATQTAANIGKVFAGIFAILSFYGNPMLMLIAIFLWFGGSAENQMEQIDVQLANIKAEDIMLREFHTLTPHDSMNKAIQFTLGSGQKHFPVMDQQQLFGLLSHEQMLQVIHDHGQDAAVEKAQLEKFQVVANDTPIPMLMHHMQEHNVPVIGVGRDQRLIGLITLDNIIEYIRINQAGMDA